MLVKALRGGMSTHGELPETDYESAQHKRYLRTEVERLSGLLGVETAALDA